MAKFPIFPHKTGTVLEAASKQSPTPFEIGRVEYVDKEELQVDVKIVRTGAIVNGISCIVTSDSSALADTGSIPSVGSYVMIGLITQSGGSQEYAILGSIRTGYKSGQALIATRSAPEFPEQNTLDRQLSRKIDDSEYLVSAASGGELLLDEGFSLLTSDGVEEKTDPITETQVKNLQNTFTQTLAGRSQQGAAIRLLPPGQSGDYAHPTGLSFIYVTPDGLDPALRYKDGSTPGLIATEEVHAYHELTDLIPDLTPHLHGQMPERHFDYNETSTVGVGEDIWSPVSSDRTPDPQGLTQPVPQNVSRTEQGQSLYLKDNLSIQYRRDLRYTHDSNLIGSFETDVTRYKSLLVPQLSNTKFTTDFNRDHQPLLPDPHPHSNFRLRVPVRAEYSPLLYNQTAYYQTKEGYQLWAMGATLADTNMSGADAPLNNARIFGKGAGRSGEISSLGGLEVVLGKTQDEEESLSLTTMGQIFAHLGSDDGISPHTNRSMQAIDPVLGASTPLDIYDFTPKLHPGDCEDYSNKLGAENISIVLTTDGGLTGRIGARNSTVKRKFVKNGFSDGQGRTSDGLYNSHNANRVTYGAGDSNYSFHDLNTATLGNSALSGITDLSDYSADAHGSSVDLHLCGDMFLRVGKSADSGVSMSLDTDGGLLWWLGKDKNGRSLTIEADGGAQIKLNSSSGDALNLFISGNVNELIEGSVTRRITGDLIETIEGSRTIEIGGNDTLLIAGEFTPIFNNYTLLCNGSGTIGFGEGLSLSVTGPMNFDATGAVKSLVTGSYNSIVTGTSSLLFGGATTVTASAKFSFAGSGMASFVSAGTMNISAAGLTLGGLTDLTGFNGGPVSMETGNLNITSPSIKITGPTEFI